MNPPLPQQQVVLSVTKNMVQQIDLICEEFQNKTLMMCPLTSACSFQGYIYIYVSTLHTIRSRSSIDVEVTVANHSGFVPQLIAAHAVSVCDTVDCYHGIRKTNVIKAMSAGIALNHL